MKKIYAASLLDLLPESILLDPKLRASAEALDAQLKSVTAATREVLHLPRLDELSGKIIDFLAEQFHIDFFEPLYLNETEKKNLIRSSIAWHRIKGTPAAVEQIAHDAFADSEILEWFEYGGEPYHFKIRSHGFKQTPDGWATFARMINTAKNVRSWCDNYELVFDDDVFGKNYAYAAALELQTGSRTVSISKPKLDSETKIFAGNANLIFGDMTESLQRPKLKFALPLFAGAVNTRVGDIKIGTSTRPHDDSDFFAYSWTSKIFANVANAVVGRKFWSLSRPRDQLVSLSVGEIEKHIGEVSINVDRKLKIAQRANLSAAQVLTKIGDVKIDTATRPTDDGNYFAHGWKNELFAGNVNHRSGEVRIAAGTSTQRLSYKTVVRVGTPYVFAGEIIIR